MSSRERWLELDGLWVHSVDWEPDGVDVDAPPVLLVHGLGASTLSWNLVADRLATTLHRRVTAIDLPGFGRTRCMDRAAGFATHRSVITAYLDERGPALLMGNSMGGALSASVAAARPELVHGLVLVNAAYPRPGRNLEQLTRTLRFAALSVPRVAAPVVSARARRLGPERLVDVTVQFVLADPDRLDGALRERLVALATERRDYPEAATAYAQSGGSLFRHLLSDMRGDLETISSPTLVLHGRRDQLVPVAFARAVARQREDWRYVELADCGHAPQLEIPDRFVEVVSAWAARELPDPTAHA